MRRMAWAQAAWCTGVEHSCKHPTGQCVSSASCLRVVQACTSAAGTMDHLHTAMGCTLCTGSLRWVQGAYTLAQCLVILASTSSASMHAEWIEGLWLRGPWLLQHSSCKININHLPVHLRHSFPLAGEQRANARPGLLHGCNTGAQGWRLCACQGVPPGNHAAQGAEPQGERYMLGMCYSWTGISGCRRDDEGWLSIESHFAVELCRYQGLRPV